MTPASLPTYPQLYQGLFLTYLSNGWSPRIAWRWAPDKLTISCAASVIAVIQLTGSIVGICGVYLQGVRNAKQDISSLQQAVMSLERTLQNLREFLQGPSGKHIFTLQILNGDIANCRSMLMALKKIDPEKKTTRRLGTRSLRWSLKRTEVERVMHNLERYKSSFTLCLQVDQATLITGISQNTDIVSRSVGLEKLPIAPYAEFDSYTDHHEDECLPGTRAELHHQIAEWAISPQRRCIFWLNGMAWDREIDHFPNNGKIV